MHRYRKPPALRNGSLAAIAAVIGIGIASPAGAQELQGRSLQPSTDLKAGVSTVLSGLLAGSRAPDGQLLGVRVEDDAPDRLTVRVRYTDLAGYRLRGLVLDRKLGPLGSISVARADLEPADGDVELGFAWIGDRSNGEADSRYLLLEVLPAGRSVAVARQWFDLRKRWSSGEGDGSQLSGVTDATSQEPPQRVAVTPVPVGRAAQLATGSPGGASPTTTHTQSTNRPHATVRRETRDDGDVPPVRSSAAARPAVRDHRAASGGSRSYVRDHRSGSPETTATRPAVRDHRQSSSGARPAVRDKRTSSSSSRPPVRDHRDRPATSGQGTSTPTTSQASGKAVLTYGMSAQDREQGAHGPSAFEVDLLADWLPDPAVDLRESDVVPFARVYQDQNADSGYFYYQPSAYRLAWDSGDGLALHMLYQAGQEGAAGNVLVRMTLDAGLDPREIQVARALLAAQEARRSLRHFHRLQRIPVDKAPEVRLAEDLEQLFDIPADKVRASGVSDALGRLDVALVTDSVTKENLQLALAQGGLGGRVVLEPSGGEVPAQQVPFSVDVADEHTYPRLYWQPGSEWRNPYPYPLRARWLHVLRLIQNQPVVYSWDLGGARVAPGSALWIDPEPVPQTIENGALRMWVDYDLDDGCAPCQEALMAEVTGGVRSLTASEITFRALTPLADTGATEIALDVRSRFFHPSSRTLRSHPVTVIDEDNRGYEVGPIYPTAAKASGEPLFEYRLRLVMPDGQVLGGERWTSGSALYQPLGLVQIEQAIGSSWNER